MKAISIVQRLRDTQRLYPLLLILFVLSVLAFFHWTDTKAFEFKEYDDLEIVSLISSVFIVAVFMERSVQAIIIPLRVQERTRLDKEISIANIKLQQGDIDSSKVDELSNMLYNYQIRTAQIALWFSFGFGLIISAAGVRVLAELVNINGIAGYQLTLFSFADVFLTGGVIAGGSAAIDKIGRQVSQIFGLSSKLDGQSGTAGTVPKHQEESEIPVQQDLAEENTSTPNDSAK